MEPKIKEITMASPYGREKSSLQIQKEKARVGAADQEFPHQLKKVKSQVIYK